MPSTVKEAGRRSVINAWWEIDALDPDGELLHPSPAWVVRQIFDWVGEEGRTLYWATQQLNGTGIKTADGVDWNPSKLQRLVRRHCYTGKHVYNVHIRVSNPDRPITDITAEIKRTRLQKNRSTNGYDMRCRRWSLKNCGTRPTTR